MGSKFLRLQWFCLFILLFLVLSCSLNLELRKPRGEKEFLEEISRLEKLAREDPVTSVRAKSHLRLAFLYVDSRNPQLNYSRALEEMESYLSISSAKTQKDDFQNWLTVLKELDRVCKDKKGMEGKNQDLQAQIGQLRFSLKQFQEENLKEKKGMEDLKTQIEKMRITLKKVQEVNKNLGDEVADLQEMIGKLKDLDYQMEERRNLIK